MQPTNTTLRGAVRSLINDDVLFDASRLGHIRNYHKLHVRRDGSLNWFESINKSDDIIDSGADHFAAVPSLITVGTGSCTCNCDHCNDVYDAADEALAKEQGREYDKDAKYPRFEDAIADAVADGGTEELERIMSEALDAIPEGYFDDEQSESEGGSK